MEKYLSIVECPWQQEKIFDEEKIKFISSKIAIWDFFSVPWESYLALPIEEKSVMFKQYYNELVSKYYSKSGNFFSVSGIVRVCFKIVLSVSTCYFCSFWAVSIDLCYKNGQLTHSNR